MKNYGWSIRVGERGGLGQQNTGCFNDGIVTSKASECVSLRLALFLEKRSNIVDHGYDVSWSNVQHTIVSFRHLSQEFDRQRGRKFFSGSTHPCMVLTPTFISVTALFFYRGVLSLRKILFILPSPCASSTAINFSVSTSETPLSVALSLVKKLPVSPRSSGGDCRSLGLRIFLSRRE